MEKDFEKPKRDTTRRAGYDEEIDRAKGARNSQKNDTNPYMEKEGFLGVDDLDRLRRRHIK
jgi:hypothetical protein